MSIRAIFGLIVIGFLLMATIVLQNSTVELDYEPSKFDARVDIVLGQERTVDEE